MPSRLSPISLLLTALGAAGVMLVWLRWLRPTGDNIIMAVLLQVAGLGLALLEFFRGDRSLACKLSLGVSAAVLALAGAVFMLFTAALRDLH